MSHGPEPPFSDRLREWRLTMTAIRQWSQIREGTIEHRKRSSLTITRPRPPSPFLPLTGVEVIRDSPVRRPRVGPRLKPSPGFPNTSGFSHGLPRPTLRCGRPLVSAYGCRRPTHFIRLGTRDNPIPTGPPRGVIRRDGGNWYPHVANRRPTIGVSGSVIDRRTATKYTRAQRLRACL